MTVAESIAKLQTLTTAELTAEFQRLHGRPPRYRSPTWLRKRIAHALQVAAFGGLSRVAREALAALQRDITFPTAPRTDPERPRGELRVGTVLQREWRGQQVRVQVTDDGFAWDGRVFKSLSAVAFAVTGSRWNGRMYFGLTERSK